MPTSSLTTTAPGGTATFPKPVGVGATTVTVNGSPATVLSTTLDTVTLNASPVKGANVVVSLTVTDTAPKETPAYNAANGTLNVTSEQKTWMDPFVDTAKWDVATSPGMSVATSDGRLIATAGSATPGASIVLTTKETFSVPFRVQSSLFTSAASIEQKAYLEVVSVDPVSLQPDGKSSAGWMLYGSEPGIANFFTQAGGRTPVGADVDVSASGLYEVDILPGETWFRSGLLETTGSSNYIYRTRRGSPDPSAIYKVRIRFENTPDVANAGTTLTVQYAAIQDATSLTADVTASRALGVAVTNQPSVTVAGPVSISGVVSTAASNPFSHIRTATASTNAVSVKSTGANLLALAVSNMGAQTVYLKLYSKAGAPSPGSDVPALTIPLPPNVVTTLDTGVSGFRFTAGLGYCITAGAADNDSQILTTAPFPKVVMSYN